MMSGIFLDRDGVINCERADYVKRWDEFEFLPAVLPALRSLARLDLPILVISNQSAIGRGLSSRATVDAIHQQARQLIQRAGGRIDGFFVCPHRPDEGCGCRKPKPGLLFQAAAAFGFALADTIFIGDALTDYQAAMAAGCRPLLVRSGRQGAQLSTLLGNDVAVTIVHDLAAAARHIMLNDRRNDG
ncbi:MAG: D-glycero-beta-D-manno-heptose-1,7-bisphosphate 7-phosphatase [Chloroflexi bacterium]|nr:MAG: D-glycero-beta-D-manno-heptose-1,7-bisphosphate 7-phosphatase [Chloroflexota bacterium]